MSIGMNPQGWLKLHLGEHARLIQWPAAPRSATLSTPAPSASSAPAPVAAVACC